MESSNTEGIANEIQGLQGEDVNQDCSNDCDFESIPQWEPPPEMIEATPEQGSSNVAEREDSEDDQAKFDAGLQEYNTRMANLASGGDTPRNFPPPDYVGLSSNDPQKSSLDSQKEGKFDPNSFWMTGNYKKIVKQVEDGAKFSDELSQMLTERAEIENQYAKKLKAWNKKWLNSLAKGLEYGSLLGSIRGGLEESNDIADMHLAMQGKLSELCSNIQAWKAENYHKGITGLKEAKKIEEGFSKGQKPWAKKYDDTLKGKQAYHSSRQILDVLSSQEEELKANKDTTTQDQLTKIQNKLKKATQDRETALDTYKEALRDIGNYNHKYKEDMEYEYEKWQSMEMKRKDFIIEKIKDFRDCIDISRFHPKLTDIYARMLQVYSNADTSKDLEWFRSHFGPDMPFIKVSFVEYDPELRTQPKGKEKLDPKQNQNSTTKEKPKEKSKVCVAL